MFTPMTWARLKEYILMFAPVLFIPKDAGDIRARSMSVLSGMLHYTITKLADCGADLCVAGCDQPGEIMVLDGVYPNEWDKALLELELESDLRCFTLFPTTGIWVKPAGWTHWLVYATALLRRKVVASFSEVGPATETQACDFPDDPCPANEPMKRGVLAELLTGVIDYAEGRPATGRFAAWGERWGRWLEILCTPAEIHNYPSSFAPPEGWLEHRVPGSMMTVWAPPGVDPFAVRFAPSSEHCFHRGGRGAFPDPDDRSSGKHAVDLLHGARLAPTNGRPYSPQTCAGGAQRDAPPSLLDRLTEARVRMHQEGAPKQPGCPLAAAWPRRDGRTAEDDADEVASSDG